MYKAISAICFSTALLIPGLALAQNNTAARGNAPGQQTTMTPPGQSISKAAQAGQTPPRRAVEQNAPGQDISEAAQARKLRATPLR
jgi:hypothetical protein